MKIAMQTNRGFTLMEVLLAATAFAIVLTAINSVFYAALRLRNKAVTSFDESLPIQQAVTMIKRDLANIVLPGGTISGAFQTTPTTGPGTGASAMDSFSAPGQASPSFFTTTGFVDETSPFGEVQKVRYVLLDSGNRTQGRDLVRYITRNLLPTLQEEGQQQWLMSGVDTMNFYFYDGTQWRSTWDSTVADPKTGLTNTLPAAIKVQLALTPAEPGRVQPAPIELVVPIAVQARTNETAQATGGQQ